MSKHYLVVELYGGTFQEIHNLGSFSKIMALTRYAQMIQEEFSQFKGMSVIQTIKAYNKYKEENTAKAEFIWHPIDCTKG